MDLIFHEKQEGFLCAQHCLNALLQSAYFTAVELASLAHQLDEEERLELSSSNVESQNMDDSGFFSIQVISKALGVWNLDLRQLQPHEITSAEILSDKNAFICHFKQHWFTIRKVGLQWFNLNSLLSGPQLITESYLCLYLTQLQQEGYSIFLVNGTLPHCEADDILKMSPVIQSNVYSTPSSTSQTIDDNDDWMYKQAIAQSIEEAETADPTLQHLLYATNDNDFEKELASAIQMSLASATGVPTETHSALGETREHIEQQQQPSREDIRARRQRFLDQLPRQ